MKDTLSQTDRSVALIGLSGVGKSSVGRLLAAQLGWPLHDTDALIAQAAGRSVPELFADEGEARFRDRETLALQAALAAHPAIIATGGGIVLRPENRALLREHALVVWLDAPTEILVARLLAHDEARPLLQGDQPAARLEALRAARADLYRAAANLQIDVASHTLTSVCEQILSIAP